MFWTPAEVKSQMMKPAVILLVFLKLQLSLSADTQEVTAKLGQDVTLPCRAPSASIQVLKWSRPDLDSEKNVFYLRGNRSLPSFQLPSYTGRVELRDPQMKGGDASVVLRNVNASDTGTYECRIAERRRRRRDAPEPISVVHLKVDGVAAGRTEAGGDEAGGDEAGGDEAGGDEAGGDEDGGDMNGHYSLVVALSVIGGLVVVGVVGPLIFINRERLSKSCSYRPPAGEQADQQL